MRTGVYPLGSFQSNANRTTSTDRTPLDGPGASGPGPPVPIGQPRRASNGRGCRGRISTHAPILGISASTLRITATASENVPTNRLEQNIDVERTYHRVSAGLRDPALRPSPTRISSTLAPSYPSLWTLQKLAGQAYLRHSRGGLHVERHAGGARYMCRLCKACGRPAMPDKSSKITSKIIGSTDAYFV